MGFIFAPKRRINYRNRRSYLEKRIRISISRKSLELIYLKIDDAFI